MVDLLNHTLLSAHNPVTGRLDALRLADTLALSTTQMAQIMGYTPSGLRKNPDSERLQDRLSEMVDLVRRLKTVFEGNLEFARIWLKAPHPDLAGKTPLVSLEQGRFDAVETLVYAMESGQPL